VTDWYAACLAEVEHFLGQYEHKSKQVVAIDSDLVAALTGLMAAAAVYQGTLYHLSAAGLTAQKLSG
jgi:hypothetical protein